MAQLLEGSSPPTVADIPDDILALVHEREPNAEICCFSSANAKLVDDTLTCQKYLGDVMKCSGILCFTIYGIACIPLVCGYCFACCGWKLHRKYEAIALRSEFIVVTKTSVFHIARSYKPSPCSCSPRGVEVYQVSLAKVMDVGFTRLKRNEYGIETINTSVRQSSMSNTDSHNATCKCCVDCDSAIIGALPAVYVKQLAAGAVASMGNTGRIGGVTAAGMMIRRMGGIYMRGMVNAEEVARAIMSAAEAFHAAQGTHMPDPDFGFGAALQPGAGRSAFGAAAHSSASASAPPPYSAEPATSSTAKRVVVRDGRSGAEGGGKIVMLTNWNDFLALIREKFDIGEKTTFALFLEEVDAEVSTADEVCANDKLVIKD